MSSLSRKHRSRQRELFLRPLRTREELHAWVQLFCNLDLPQTSVCAGHDAPFEYLCRSYFEPGEDQVVHAPRGGGKTRLAALATLLDLVHKPGLSVRILAGSLEQSMKMWEHLLPDLERGPRELLERRIGSARHIKLTTGSSVAVLTQSQRSVRGLRVQKLRCDEVELFKPEVWEAAQLVTRSIPRRGSSDVIHGAIDALSTLHTPHGLMQQILDSAQASGTRVTKWCLLDVLQRCEPQRECARCSLWDECQGRAKTMANGYVRIDDAIRTHCSPKSRLQNRPSGHPERGRAGRGEESQVRREVRQASGGTGCESSAEGPADARADSPEVLRQAPGRHSAEGSRAVSPLQNGSQGSMTFYQTGDHCRLNSVSYHTCNKPP